MRLVLRTSFEDFKFFKTYCFKDAPTDLQLLELDSENTEKLSNSSN